MNKKKVIAGTGAAVLALSLLGGGIAATAGGVGPGLTASTQDVAKTDPATGAAVKVDAQSQVVKDLGEAGNLTEQGETKPTFSIAVNSVKAVDSCKLRGFGTEIKPDNGKFLIVNVEATLDKSANEAVKESEAIMPVDASSFGVSAGSGSSISYNLNTEKSFGCEVSNPLDIAVGAGDTIRGNVVLDSSVSTGELVYNPLSDQQKRTGGWSWSF